MAITRTGDREEMIRLKFSPGLRDRARKVIGMIEHMIRLHEERVLGHEIDEPEPIDEGLLADVVELAILGQLKS